MPFSIFPRARFCAPFAFDDVEIAVPDWQDAVEHHRVDGLKPVATDLLMRVSP